LLSADDGAAAGAPRPLVTLGSLTPPPVAPRREPKAPEAPVITTVDATPSHRVRGPSSYAIREVPRAEPARESGDLARPNRSMWALFAVAGIVFAVGARLSRDRELAHSAAAALPGPVEARAPETPVLAPAPAAEIKGEGESKVDPILPQEGPLRADDKVPPGQGMLEVVAGTSDTIWIDGTLVGNGPMVKRALAPKKEPYEIRVKLRGEERVRFVLVKESRLTRLRIAPPWSR
jgi:hypothetical protein